MTNTSNVAEPGHPTDIWMYALKEASIAFILAALLLSFFYVSAFRWIHPKFVPFMDREAAGLITSGKDLIPVSVGGYRIDGSSTIIEDFNGDEAVLALPRGFQAELYPFIKVNLTGLSRYSRAKILWNKEGDSAIHGLEFNRHGDGVTQIAMVYANDNYRGKINSIAILIYDGAELRVNNNNDAAISLKSIELKPFSIRNFAAQLAADLVNPPLWSHHSSNTVIGVHENSVVLPNVVCSLLVAISILLIACNRINTTWKPGKRPRRAPLTYSVFAACMIAWVLMDSFRWIWRIEQLQDAYARYGGKTLTEKSLYSDLRCSRFPDCGSKLHPYL